MKLWYLFLLSLPLSFCNGYTRHTNIKCTVLNESVCEIPVCRLKLIGRNRVGANVVIKNLKPPATKVVQNFSVWRKLNGYHPFLFNVTVDFCHHMSHPNPLNVYYYFHRAFMPFSNLNHTCPYTDDIIVKDFVMTDDMFDRVPVPKGSYMFHLMLAANSVWAAEFRFYLDIDVKQTLRSTADMD
ncbi:hypothetical protein KR222_009316 [Zaprionus bogoriensis]|nr:hypothetical protein KR222_009316 [Zaprionus bogoriensis]